MEIKIRTNDPKWGWYYVFLSLFRRSAREDGITTNVATNSMAVWRTTKKKPIDRSQKSSAKIADFLADTHARAKNTVLHSCAAAAAVDDDAAVHSFKRVTQPSAQHSTQWYLSVDIVYGYRNAAKHRLLSCVALWLFLLFSFCYFFFLFAGSTQMLKAHTKSASAHSFHTGWLSTTKLFATAQSGVYMKPFSSQSACCKQQQNI